MQKPMQMQGGHENSVEKAFQQGTKLENQVLCGSSG